MPLQAFIGCYKKQNDKLLLVAIRVEDEESKRLANELENEFEEYETRKGLTLYSIRAQQNLKEKFEYLQKVIK
jgi:translation initiation factor 6 (eIF-6)